MPTSNKTNEEIMKVLDQHLTYHQQLALFDALAKVQGNSSFTKSIQMLNRLIHAKYQK